MDKADEKLDGIEEATGMHTFIWRPDEDPFSINIEATRSLDDWSTTLGVIEMRFSGLIQLVETICGYNEYIVTMTPSHRQEKMHEDKLLLQEKMRNAVKFF